MLSTIKTKSFEDTHTQSEIAEIIETLHSTFVEDSFDDLSALDNNQHVGEICNNRYDSWRFMVEEYIDGRCLDLYAGYGRRSLALAEISDSVYAVDPDVTKLRILEQRRDFDSHSRVTAVHADENSLPFQEAYFDTVIVDLTGRNTHQLKSRIELFNSLVNENGSLLLLVDGWIRRLGISGMIDLDNSTPSLSRDSIAPVSTQVNQYLESIGYESIKTYPLYPTTEELRFMYEFGSRYGSQKFLDIAANAKSKYPLLTRAVHTAGKVGLLDRLYPNYLIVGSSGSTESSIKISQPVLSTGRARSVVFDFSDGLSSVWKIPNRLQNAGFNEREHQILQHLKSQETQIRHTLPEGELINSRFGAIRKELPVNGKPLSQVLKSPTNVSREDALSIGINWLINFQQPSTRPSVKFSLEEFLERYKIPLADIELPAMTDSVEFFRTPVHGDLTPENIYLEQENVSKVLDWEYGATNGNPVVDAGFFIVQVLCPEGSSSDEVMIEIIEGTSPLADLGKEYISKYCNESNVSQQTFYILLPTLYLHQINVDLSINQNMKTNMRALKHLNRFKKVWSSASRHYSD